MMLVYAVAVLLLALVKGTEVEVPPTVEAEATKSEVCQQFYVLTSEFLDELKSSQPKWYKNVAFFARFIVHVDISNPQEVKLFICQLTGLESVKDLQQMTSRIKGRPVDYDRLLREYQGMQAKIGAIGGYTNIPRILDLAHDLRLWMEELPLEGPGPSEVVDLDKLTDFFREMQVKYGSRWLSLIAMSKNQMVLIEDPARMAKQLHDCPSPACVQQILEIKSDPAVEIYKHLLRNRPKDVSMHIHLLEIVARLVYGLGEIGLFTLPN